jgi:hypothetical protein
MYVDGVAPHRHVVENGSVGNICYRGFQSTPYMIQFLYLHIPSSNKRLSIIEYQQYMIFKVSFVNGYIQKKVMQQS